jgi:AcrR family transcriptional regulator
MRRNEEIILRATELFHLHGFIATSIEDIADAIGIKREGIYYYFKDKSDILYAVIKPTSDALLRGLKRVVALPLSAEERLYLAVENHLNQFTSNHRQMEIIFRAVYAKERGNRPAHLAKTWSAYGHLWAELIQSGIDAGEFAATLDPGLVSRAMLGSCNTFSTWYDPDGEITLTEFARTYFSLFAYGLFESSKGKRTRTSGNGSALRAS